MARRTTVTSHPKKRQDTQEMLETFLCGEILLQEDLRMNMSQAMITIK